MTTHYLPQVTWTPSPGDLDAAQIKNMVQPIQLTVHDLVKDEQPYLGFGFTCKWDPEHGLGVLMHGAHCVEVGGADTAFLGWIARRHAEAR